MKRMTILLLTSLLAVHVFAVEYGVMVSTNTDFKFSGNVYDSLIFAQSETLTPYVKVPFNDTMYLAAEGLFKHKLSDIFSSKSYKATNDFVLDLTLLKFNKLFKFDNNSLLELSAGRMYSVDSTGIILGQTNDGIALKYNMQSVVFGGYIGYSGLQNVKDVEMLSSKGSSLILMNEKKFYDFAMPYLIASLSVNLPNLFADQTLTIETLGAIPIVGPNELPKEEETRVYATFMFNGPIIPSLYYNGLLTMEVISYNKLALLSKLDVTYYLPFKDATVGFSAVYASGNNGVIKPFVGLTNKNSCFSAKTLNYSGIIKTGLSSSIVPLKNMIVSLGTDFVFDVMNQPDFCGWQLVGAAKWNIFSDFQVSAGASTFIGKEKEINCIEFYVGATISL